MASKCADCAWRKRSEENPKTFMARIWRWHTKVCPAGRRTSGSWRGREQESDE